MMTKLIDADALLEYFPRNPSDIDICPIKDLLDIITNAPTVGKGEWVGVPNDLLDRFPEINLNNYGDDEVRDLNNWALDVVNSATPTVYREKFVVQRQMRNTIVYAYAHPHGVFDWGTLDEAVKLDTKLEAEALIASMALYGDDSVSVSVDVIKEFHT